MKVLGGLRHAVLLCLAGLVLVGCSDAGEGDASSTASSAADAGSQPVSAPDAVRLAKQATFGPTQPLVDHIVAVGLNGWLDEQFAATGSSYADLTARARNRNYCNLMAGAAATVCNRDYMSSIPISMRFYSNAMSKPDQLRQRVAFALSQIIVASDLEVHSTGGQAALNQIFIENAFGNYRDILLKVTQSGFMGDYLDLANSSKNAPNENYARELMQLFSMGLNKLNADGSEQLVNGASVPIYTAADVKDVARALTGWTYARFNNAPLTDNNQLDYSAPMMSNLAAYDTGAKTFLGKTLPAGASQNASVIAVVDAIFNESSTAPFISKQLIMQLVTSNPSPAYVTRVSNVFADNGAGVRGDMRAVVRAILIDPEARGDAKLSASDGKVKEPVLLSTAIGRLAGFTSDGYAFTTRDSSLGQQPFRAPSVFNFYPPDYPLPQGNGLLSPPSKLMTTATTLARHNLVYDWTVSGDPGRSEYLVQAAIPDATGTQPDWSGWEGLSDAAIISRIDLLMLNNTMTTDQRATLQKAMTAITNPNPALQARKRAQMAIYVVGTSPNFQTDR